METLPLELHLEIFSYLDFLQRRCLRLVNKKFADVAAISLFTELKFAGYHPLPPMVVGNGFSGGGGPGRYRYASPTVKFTRIHDVVTEVLPIAGYVKKFRFEPAYLVKDFWSGLRQRLQRDYEMLTATSQSSSSPEDDDVDMGREIAPGTSLTVRNATDRDDQREKLGKELSWIIYHDDYWQKCVAEQIDHEATVVRSLAVLLSAMTRLEKIEIRSPELSSDLFRRIRTIQTPLYEPDDKTTTAYYLQIIAQGLRAGRRQIEALDMTPLTPDLVHDTEAARDLFSGLTSLQLGLWDMQFPLQDIPHPTGFSRLIQCASPTLLQLQLWSIDPSLMPSLDTKPVVFPRLKTLHLRFLRLGTQVLIEFMVAQPSITELRFDCITLDTRKGWEAVILAIPATVHTWKDGGLFGEGHGATGMGVGDPFMYSHLGVFPSWIGKKTKGTALITFQRTKKWRDAQNLLALVVTKDPGLEQP